MTDIEKKALALLQECGWGGAHLKRTWNPRYEALCRAIKQHEAYKQEVSDAVLSFWKYTDGVPGHFERFIIAKTDPLVEVINDADDMVRKPDAPSYAEAIRAALAARGLQIVEVGHD